MSKQLTHGTKRICQSTTCALPFYDLNRTDIWCPNCGTVFDTSVVLHPRRNAIGAVSGRGVGKGAHALSAARRSEAKRQPPQLDDDLEAAPTNDEVIDADADTLPLEDDSVDEIADVVAVPEDSQADR